MAFLLKLLVLASIITLSLCTPDCYNTSATSVARKWNSFNEQLPPSLSNFRADWFTLKPGQNCAFYTFNDIYFSSFNPNLQGIYLNFLNGTVPGSSKTQCTLESTKMSPFISGTWLYANSSRAPEGMCGYYVGIANSDTQQDLTFQIIRFRTEKVSKEAVTSIAYKLSDSGMITLAMIITLIISF